MWAQLPIRPVSAVTTIPASGQAEELRLWAGSALAALLVHLAVAALLFVRIPSQPRLSPLAGSPVALDVELASPPSSRAPAASVALGSALPSRQPQSLSKRLALRAASELQVLTEVQPLVQEAAPPPSDTPVPAAAGTSGLTPELSPLTAPTPMALAQPHGQLDVPQSPEQQWLDEVKSQLQRYRQYPRSAVKKLQQDTVTLKFSVNRAGRVTYVRVDSVHHYRALEQEARRMLREAGTLPAPSAQVPVDKLLVNVPVDFYLTAATPSPAPCAAAAGPGPAPAAATATLQQMSAYRERLKRYVAAAGKELNCLQAPQAAALASRDTLSRRLHTLVDNFNTEARMVEAKVQAQAVQAQQAHQRQLQVDAAQVYADCAPPVAPQAPGSLNASSAESYRRNLLGYQSAVRAYVACIREAQSAATAPGRGLAIDQRARIDQTAVQLGDAAILPFNRLASGFNGQLPRLRRALAAQTQQNLAEALVRASRIFPNSTWDVAAPLPADECFSIARAGQTYQAQLCQSTYVTNDIASLGTKAPQPALVGPANSSLGPEAKAFADAYASVLSTGAQSGMPGDATLAEATTQEHIAALHGYPGSGPHQGDMTAPILGIEVAPSAQAGQNTEMQVHTTYYSVSELQVDGRHISLTISRTSDEQAGREDLSAEHFDLVLSPDNQTLQGYCWTGEQRRQCALTRHLASN